MKVATFNLMLFGVNCYVVFDPESKQAIIIDPGIVDDRETTAIDNFLIKNGLTVVGIVNTHLHIDHALGNAALKDKYNVDVMAHEGDKPLGNSLAIQSRQFGLPFKINSAGVTKYLKDGDKIKIGNGELEVIHVPGHSPGGIGLYDATDGFLISGDTLFEGSIGRSDLPGGDIARLFESIKKRFYALPDNTVVYPGHGAPTTIGKEKISNPYVHG